MRRLLSAISLVTMMIGASTIWAAEQHYMSVGTGSVTGVYYPAGGAICWAVNKRRREHGIRCSVESTNGSIYNIKRIAEGELEFGVVQSDWQRHAYHGTSIFSENGAVTGLRSVFSLYPEAFTIVARADAAIASLDDLKGKRVNIGNPGSGQRATMEIVMDAQGWTTDDFAETHELTASDQSHALCQGEIDAMVYVVGHPSASIREATQSCDSVIISVTGPAIDLLVQDNSFYRAAIIPGALYRGNDQDIPSFGVGATLVTSINVPQKTVYTLVKAVFENLAQFRQSHPAFSYLREEEMIKDSLSAPLHPGAIQYYIERGWM